MMGKYLMLLVAVVPGWGDVDGGVDEARDVVQKLVVGGDGDLVTVDDGEGGVDEQGYLGAHAVPDPAQAQ